MSTCKEKSTLSPFILSIKEKAKSTPLKKIMEQFNAIEYDMYYTGWEADSKFWLLEDGLMITTNHCQIVEFTQEDYQAYKQNLQNYIFNLPNIEKPTQNYKEIKDPWEEMAKLKKPTIVNKQELTVQELINKLKELPQNTKVLIDGYESGLDSIVDAYPIKAKFLEKSNWWDGIYEESDSDIDAVYLKSTRRIGE